MSTFDRVKAANTPQDALLAIAHSLDVLYGELAEFKSQQPTSDPWGEWTVQPDELTPEQIDGAKARIEALKELLEVETDSEERQALEAQLRLQRDKLVDAPAYIDTDGDRAENKVDDDGNVVVELPTVSETKRLQRIDFADNVLDLEEQLPLIPGVLEIYAKGGPLWLYYGNRDLVMSFPDDWRRAMVADVAEESPGEALEMGRDVLKDLGTGSNDVTMEALSG